jgi:serine/threonine-protein kinase RsbW
LANHQVVLTVPAQPEFLRVVRMTASGLGSRLGFNIDEVDDLRLALDELCFALIGKGTEGLLRLVYVLEEDALVISGEIEQPVDGRPESTLNDLSRQILSALVDDHDLGDVGGKRTFRLTKRQATETFGRASNQ